MPARTLVLAVLACLVLVATSAPARADGDPASDVLYTQDVFLPYARPSADVTDALQRQVDAVWSSKGARVKVAVIQSPTDLGSIPSLFGKPADYASFLGQELTLVYRGPLLVVMAAGFGVYDHDRSTAGELRVLAGLKVGGSSSDDLTKAAATAVDRLFRAGALSGKDIVPPVASALPASGRRGAAVKLRYRLSDDSGQSGATLQVLAHSRRPLATFQVPVRNVTPTMIYAVVWKVPERSLKQPLAVCIAGVDGAGTRSARSCAKLRLVATG